MRFATTVLVLAAGLAPANSAWQDSLPRMSCLSGHDTGGLHTPQALSSAELIRISRDAVRAVDICWLKTFFHPWLEEAICPTAPADERCVRMEWNAADLQILRRAQRWQLDPDESELGSHYQLLHLLASHFNDETFIDIGTGFGAGGRADE